MSPSTLSIGGRDWLRPPAGYPNLGKAPLTQLNYLAPLYPHLDAHHLAHV